MASGRAISLSVNFCLLLCIIMILDSPKFTASWNCTHSNDSDVYYVSQMNSKTELANFPSRSKTTQRHDLNDFQKGFVFCKLVKRTYLAIILIALSGDIELNPGFLMLDDMRKTRGLKIAHLNIRSLRHKVDSLQLEGINNKTVDILTLSETWLDSTVEDSEIALPGFNCVRKDRTGLKEGYGGVAIYLHERLPYRVREDVNSGDNECLWIEITRSKCKPTIICCAYRAPDADFVRFITNLENGISNIDLEKSDFVLLGDLNINMLPNSKNRLGDRQKLLINPLV